MKIGLIALVALVWPLVSGTPPTSPAADFHTRQVSAGVIWYELEEGLALAESKDKKVLLDVYTEWCGWCKRMDKTTYEHPEIAAYLNDHFVSVRFDAEYRGDITFRGKTYSYVREGQRGYHELAAELLRGRLSFPTTVFLEPNGDPIQAIIGYKTPGDFEQILTYFAGDHYRTTPWSTYQRNFISSLGN